MPQNITTQIAEAQSWVNANATINTSLTYEMGVIAALKWIGAITTTPPIQGYFDGKQGVSVSPVDNISPSPTNTL